MEDSELLNVYLDTGSTDAFHKLMSRHIDMVYSAARRQLRDEHLAQDVTQAVFILLARKAHSIRNRASLPGWLGLATHNAPRDARKIEKPRRLHEHKAARMTLLRDRTTQENPAWDAVSPELDAALARLNSKHRNIVAMHYMEGRSFREVGATLGISEDAARLSCARAIHKLRRTLGGRGAVVSAAALTSMLALNSARATPIAVKAAIASAIINPSTVAASGNALAIANRVSRTLELAKATFAGGTALTALVILSLGVLAVATNLDRLKPQPAALSLPPLAAALSGDFRPGGRVELVAISHVTEGAARTWWAPDGSTPLLAPDHSASLAFPPADHEHREPYEFAFRVLNLTPNAHDIWVNVSGEPHGNRGFLLKPTEHDAKGLVYAAALLPPEETVTNISVGLSTGGWYTATLDPTGQPVGTLPKGLGSLFPVKIVGRPDQSLLCLPTEPFMRYDYQAVAIDTSGDEHPILANAPRFTGSIANGSMTPVFTFDIPPEKVGNFQLSVRHTRHFMVFRRVSLRAGVDASPIAQSSVALCEPDKAVYDTDYLSMVEQLTTSLQSGDIESARKTFTTFATATHKRCLSLDGTTNAYLVPLAQPVLDRLSTALHAGDSDTALQLLNAETPEGNNLWQLTHQLAMVMPVTSLQYP